MKVSFIDILSCSGKPAVVCSARYPTPLHVVLNGRSTTGNPLGPGNPRIGVNNEGVNIVIPMDLWGMIGLSYCGRVEEGKMFFVRGQARAVPAAKCIHEGVLARCTDS